MLQRLDDEIISFCPAVEIAALSEKEQKELLVAMEYAQAIEICYSQNCNLRFTALCILKFFLRACGY